MVRLIREMLKRTRVAIEETLGARGTNNDARRPENDLLPGRIGRKAGARAPVYVGEPFRNA